MVVGDVGVLRPTAPGELQHHHAGSPDGLAQLVHVAGDDSQVLCNDGDMAQPLHRQMRASLRSGAVHLGSGGWTWGRILGGGLSVLCQGEGDLTSAQAAEVQSA